MDKRTECDDFFKDRFDQYQGEVDQGAWERLLGSLQNITTYNYINKTIISIMLLASVLLLSRDTTGALTPEKESFLSVNDFNQKPVEIERTSNLDLKKTATIVLRSGNKSLHPISEVISPEEIYLVRFQ